MDLGFIKHIINIAIKVFLFDNYLANLDNCI